MKGNTMNWLMNRLKEPSSYAAIGVGIIGIGLIINVMELAFIGVAASILGLIIAEEKK